MAQCLVRSCEICENSPGNRFCKDCEQFFCTTCEIFHLKTKPCRNHNFQDSKFANLKMKTPICKQHAEKFTFYCNTCSSLICNSCLPQTHKIHDFCLINDAVSNMRSRFETEVQKARNKIQIFDEKIWFTRSTLKTLEDKADIAKRNIMERVVVFVNAYEEAKYAYFKSIDKHTEEESRRLKQEITIMKNATDNREEILNKTKNSIDGQNNTILLDSSGDITKILESISEDNIKKEMPSYIRFDPVTALPEVEKLIGNIKFL